MIEIYIDGGCIPNPGTGGWAVSILEHGKRTHSFSGIKLNTTNNQMELQAAIEALKYFTEPTKLEVTADSQYVLSGITQWVVQWEKNGWMRKKSEVKNLEQWKELYELSKFHEIDWFWIKSHSGDRENDYVDSLVTKAISASNSGKKGKIQFKY